MSWFNTVLNPTIQPAVALPTSFVQRDVPCEFVGIANFDLKNIQFTPNHSGNLLLPAKKPAPRRRKAGQAGTRKVRVVSLWLVDSLYSFRA